MARATTGFFLKCKNADSSLNNSKRYYYVLLVRFIKSHTLYSFITHWCVCQVPILGPQNTATGLVRRSILDLGCSNVGICKNGWSRSFGSIPSKQTMQRLESELQRSQWPLKAKSKGCSLYFNSLRVHRTADLVLYPQKRFAPQRSGKISNANTVNYPRAANFRQRLNNNNNIVICRLRGTTWLAGHNIDRIAHSCVGIEFTKNAF